MIAPMAKEACLRYKRLITVGVVTILMSGCLTGRVNRVMESWRGHHYSDLVMAWGPPSAVYDDGQGGRMLVYYQARQVTTPGRVTTTTTGQATIYDNMIWSRARSVSEFVPPQTYGYTAWRIFRVDRNGRVYSWSWQGL